MLSTLSKLQIVTARVTHWRPRMQCEWKQATLNWQYPIPSLLQILQHSTTVSTSLMPSLQFPSCRHIFFGRFFYPWSALVQVGPVIGVFSCCFWSHGSETKVSSSSSPCWTRGTRWQGSTSWQVLLMGPLPKISLRDRPHFGECIEVSSRNAPQWKRQLQHRLIRCNYARIVQKILSRPARPLTAQTETPFGKILQCLSIFLREGRT